MNSSSPGIHARVSATGCPNRRREPGRQRGSRLRESWWRRVSSAARFVFVLTIYGILTACVGESRFQGADRDDLLAVDASSDALSRVQGRWTAKTSIGRDEIEKTVVIEGSTLSVEVQSERSGVAIIDVLDAAPSWVRLLVMHPSSSRVETLRFDERGGFWLEHYPHTIYRRTQDPDD